MNRITEKKHLNYYDTNKVLSYFFLQRKLRPEFDFLINNLEEFGELILVGGAIRDIVLKNQAPRDLDIIVDTDDTNLEDAFCGVKYKKNRFGGYKIIFDFIEIDIWSIRNNWAFKEGHLEHSINNLQKGAFFNIDSVFVNLNNGDFLASFFDEAIKNRCLDIVLPEHLINCNPYAELNVVRSFLLQKAWDLEFSSNLEKYLHTWFFTESNPKEKMRFAEERHFGCRKLSESDYSVIFEKYCQV